MKLGAYKGEPQLGQPGRCMLAQVFGPDGKEVLTIEPTDDPAVATRISAICAAALTSAFIQDGVDRLQAIIDIALDPQSPLAFSTIVRLARELQAEQGKRP